MSAAERVAKFYEDATKLCPTKPDEAATSDPSNSKAGGAKIVAEMNKLRVWLQKHQNETIPEGAKTKLFQTVDLYYRKAIAGPHRDALLDPVTELLGCYLQMPEGKLVGARDKKKILNWLEAMKAHNAACDRASASNKNSLWIVQSVDEDSQSVTLLSCEDDELWKENVQVEGDTLYETIRNMMEISESVIVELDESDKILRVSDSR